MRTLRATLCAFLLAVGLPCVAAADEIRSCPTGGEHIAGQLPALVANATDKVYVMPQTATTDLYLNYLHLLFPTHPSVDTAVSLLMHRGEFTDATTASRAVMRAAAVDAAGRFRCGGLGSGAYRVLAFVRPGATASPTQSRLTILFANAVASSGAPTISPFGILGGTP